MAFQLLAVGVAARAQTDVVELEPVADTTLIETAPNNNLGAAWFFNAGSATTGTRNHGLLRFDFTGIIPAGAVIESAQLTLSVTRQPAAGGQDSTFGLYRVLRPWGEGDKTHQGTPEAPISPGLGTPAGVNDATWNDRFALSGQPWTAPGAAPNEDYTSLASSVQFIQGILESPYVFSSTPELVNDVQSWLDQPAANFGWMLISDAESEGIPSTARSFGARENADPALRPHLMVTYTPVPEPGTAALWSVGVLGAVWLSRRKRR